MIITDLFTALTEIATKFGAFLGGIFTSIADVFYTTTESGGELTIVGIFALIGLVGGFSIWALRWVLSLLKLK